MSLLTAAAAAASVSQLGQVWPFFFAVAFAFAFLFPFLAHFN